MTGTSEIKPIAPIKRIKAALLDALEECGFSADDFDSEDMLVLALAAIDAVMAEHEVLAND